MKLSLVIISCLLLSCKSKNITKLKHDSIQEPPAIIYKTKADYYKNVPVTLSEDKTRINSYPHPTDLKSGDIFQYPIKLDGGFLLDNRGINRNVAFLKLTYEEYSKMLEVPSLEELYLLIIDNNPILEMYECGNRLEFINNVKELNGLINDKILSTRCKKIK